MITPVSALYIDVSIMSSIPSLIAAAVITLGAVAGVMWRKVKKKVKTNLNIDENAGKKFEDDIELIEETAPAQAEEKKDEAETAQVYTGK